MQAEVKKHARKDVVRITEHGEQAFIFCSEEVFEQRLQQAINQALEEQEIAQAIERGRADIAAGNYLSGTTAVRKETESRRLKHA